MRIAVCFSGLIRTGCSCSTNLLKYFGELLPHIDFFVHTWDYENQAIPFDDCIYRDTTLWNNIIAYQPHILQPSKIDKFLSIYNPKKYEIESYNPTEFDINLRNPLWISFYKSINILDSYRVETITEYDYVVKIRPDMLIKETTLMDDINLLNTLDDNSILICNLGSVVDINAAFTDDVLFVARWNCMRKVSKYGEPIEQRLSFMKYLLMNNIHPYNTTNGTYAILRPYSLHLNVVDEFDLIRREDFSFYTSEEHFNTIFKN